MSSSPARTASKSTVARDPRDWLTAGTKIIARGETKPSGVLTGATFACRLEGCLGVRVSVKWKDKTQTYPCSKGLTVHTDGTLEIR